MNECLVTMNRGDGSVGGMIGPRLAVMVSLLATAGCVSVKAPDKPIEINLNINVKQEVVVSLKKDAEDFITSNPELFPK
jgi:hypothetical protein